MVKKGNKLVCKITSIFYKPWTFFPVRIEKDGVYTILKIEEGIVTLSIDNDGPFNFQDFSFTKKKYKYYIWDFFYSPAEWRNKQIDSILND